MNTLVHVAHPRTGEWAARSTSKTAVTVRDGPDSAVDAGRVFFFSDRRWWATWRPSRRRPPPPGPPPAPQSFHCDSAESLLAEYAYDPLGASYERIIGFDGAGGLARARLETADAPAVVFMRTGNASDDVHGRVVNIRVLPADANRGVPAAPAVLIRKADGVEAWVAPSRGNYGAHILTPKLPRASVASSMPPLRRNWPELAWSKHGRQGRFVTSRPVVAGDHWTLDLTPPLLRQARVTIETGSERYPWLVAPAGSVLVVTLANGTERSATARMRQGTLTVPLSTEGEAVRRVQLRVGPGGGQDCLVIDAVTLALAAEAGVAS